ncbi:uncharacterized protein NECHADRAFT_79769 [Fusarium vanettenii 77-13-4]|uniref:Zn(2)-C6 fungal-type domain-containing protein n=1 Tax=Fusarium vanettenii (strain ATCC MYA-4622 / CBS 123669 / FGSC 9596 / NRRL 45880 / 77-13-4) TaxID=660122 RepID=C7ZM21_FUSV7|nr:uncharacterized protein NECHADRAFT_79769 [Fusarium vanettenii 77-13-4]EEU34889.1 predicted protein [Fusarium vanettenii 77-13-4]
MVPSRLRGCCDSCTRSKLKCSGERPSCQRCQLRGQDCIYSKARRAGRPRVKQNKSHHPPNTVSIGQEPPLTVVSPGNHAVNRVHSSDSEQSLLPTREPALPPADSHNTASSMQDGWNQEPADPSLEFCQASNIPDIDDMMLHDLLWTNTEGFNSVPSGNVGLDWNRGNTSSNRAPPGADLQHGMSTDRPASKASAHPAERFPDTVQKTTHSRPPSTQTQAEINAIIASITNIAEQSTISHHIREELCTSSWPQLLSKAQLLMSIAGVQGSESPASLRLDAVLHVAWAAEHVQWCVSRCATCMSQEMEIFGILALIYDWIAKCIAYALEDSLATQNHQLIIGDLVLTGHKSTISIHELIKHRIIRARHVMGNIKSRITNIGQRDPDKLDRAVQLIFQRVDSRLEALSGMMELLASEHYYKLLYLPDSRGQLFQVAATTRPVTQ